MDKLKPCPFCGNDSATIHTDDTDEAWWVTCTTDGCEADGPVRDYRSKLSREDGEKWVVDAWNRRAQVDELTARNAELLEAAKDIIAFHDMRSQDRLQAAIQAAEGE